MSRAAKHMTRFNDIAIISSSPAGAVVPTTTASFSTSVAAFDIICHEYSDVGPGRRFHVNFTSGSFKPIANVERDGEPVVDDVGGDAVEEGADECPSDVEDVVEEVDDAWPSAVTTPITGATIVAQSRLSSGHHTAAHCPRRVEEEQKLPTLEKKDVVSHAVHRVLELCSIHDGYRVIRDGNESMPEYLLAEKVVVREEKRLVQGWGRRPPRGEMYGTSFIVNYRSEIGELFRKGEIDKSDKLHSSWMLGELEEKYPHAIDLPTESEIKKEISRRLQLKGKEQSEKLKSTRNFMGDKYVNAIRALLQCNAQLMPAAGLSALKAEFRVNGALPPDFPSDVDVKRKFSSEKSRRKRKSGE